MFTSRVGYDMNAVQVQCTVIAVIARISTMWIVNVEYAVCHGQTYKYRMPHSSPLNVLCQHVWVWRDMEGERMEVREVRSVTECVFWNYEISLHNLHANSQIVILCMQIACSRNNQNRVALCWIFVPVFISVSRTIDEQFDVAVI